MQANLKEVFPQEYYIKIENDQYRIGRLSVNKLAHSFCVEIDIVSTEGHKIFKHVGILYNEPSKEEAIDAGVQRLSNFLSGHG